MQMQSLQECVREKQTLSVECVFNSQQHNNFQTGVCFSFDYTTDILLCIYIYSIFMNEEHLSAIGRAGKNLTCFLVLLTNEIGKSIKNVLLILSCLLLPPEDHLS